MKLHRFAFGMAFSFLILSVFYETVDVFTLLACLIAMLLCALLEIKKVA